MDPTAELMYNPDGRVPPETLEVWKEGFSQFLEENYAYEQYWVKDYYEDCYTLQANTIRSLGL